MHIHHEKCSDFQLTLFTRILRGFANKHVTFFSLHLSDNSIFYVTIQYKLIKVEPRRVVFNKIFCEYNFKVYQINFKQKKK